MNERIAKLYDQAIVLEGNGDYVSGELDPVKFAQLIVRDIHAYVDGMDTAQVISNGILRRYGVEV
jgi:hypothetical protein